ncbi:TerB family tellurite resistance protein [Vibrio alginolyticus]|uniref:tellurite resistance TerB family protein n=1 Tax=Vibrio TaxID=662 RepID=UPI001CDB9591|nr:MULTISPECIES: TerB family tellurite resistance protein [Vibrio]MCA2450704.1 TerB family tellurite resistance protein [Vibrio alginolyticus]MCA2474100.1 TerB family tellurite resistance protein [Vibrio alginolyticus]MDW2154126.1 TerB family tellurite resistance protein [Vibrio sp. 2092]MDW2230710.1 TerB family tellurite resistance protein [Vibrio sp. 2091]
MSNILNSIREAAKESSAFENHAAKELSLEGRLLYLQGLALVMNADGEIHEEEKDYLLILIKSFDLDESIFDVCIDFANQPDKSIIQSILKYFKRKTIAQLFLFDALMMSYRDGDISVSEKNVIDEFARQFEVSKGTFRDIFDLFCYMKNKNWQESTLYFNADLLSIKLFGHILSYYEVNLDELSQRTQETYKRKILANIKDKIHGGLNNEVLLSLLQSKIDRREITVQNGVLIIPNLNDVKLTSIKLGYHALSQSLYVDSTVLIDSNELKKYFFGSVGLNEVDRYRLEVGNQTVTSSQIGQNVRILKLTNKVKNDGLIDINGTLWKYKKIGDSLSGGVLGDVLANSFNSLNSVKTKTELESGKFIVCSSKKDFTQVDNLTKIRLHHSLTNSSISGELLRFFR